MAIDKVSFILEMVDKASGASKDAEKALKALNKELGLVDKAEKKAGASLDHLKKKWEENRKAANEFGGAISKAVGAVLGIATAAGAMAVAAEMYSIKAADFQDRTLGALGALEGGDAAARKTLDSLQGAANKAGLRTGEVTKFYTELRNAGFQVKETQAIIAGGLDVGAIMGDPGAAMRIIETIKGAKSKMTMDSGSVEGLGIGTLEEYGKALAAVEPKYAKFATANERQIRMALDGGLVEASRGSDAILKLIQTKFDKGGGLGSAAKKYGGNSLDGRVNGLRNALDSVFADASVKGPLLDALKSLTDLLDGNTATGKELRAVLGGAFKTIADTIAKFATPKNLKELVETLTTTAKVAWDVTSAFFKGLYAGFMAVVKPIQEVWAAIHPGTTDLKMLGTVAGVVGIAIGGLAAILGLGLAVALAGVAVTLGVVAAPFIALGAVILGTIDAVARFVSWIGGPLNTALLLLAAPLIAIAAPFVAVGYAIAEGISKGIGLFEEKILGRTKNLGELMQKGLKGNLEIHSPSRVFQRIGEYTVLGLIEGIEAQNDNGVAAMTALASPITEMATPSLSSPTILSGGSSGGSASHVTVGELHVHLHVDGGSMGDPQAFIASITPELRQAILSILSGAAKAA